MKSLIILNFFTLALFVNSKIAFSTTLKEYRKNYQSNESKSATTLSEARASVLLKNLGIPQGLQFPNLQSIINSSQSHKTQHASNFIRDVFLKKARQFRSDDQYGRPLLFEPSSTLTFREVEEKNQARFNEFCKKEFLPNLSIIISQYYFTTTQGTLKQNTKESRNTSATKEVENFLYEKLSAQDRNVLGNLQSAFIEDGTLWRITFVTDTKVIPVGFEMLSSVLSGEDQYFIETLRCFKDLVENDLIEKTKKLNEETSKFLKSDSTIKTLQSETERISSVAKDLEEKLNGAKRLNETLTSLSKEGLKTLAGVFIIANRSDIPVDNEMIEFNESIEKITAPVLYELNQARISDATTSTPLSKTALQSAEKHYLEVAPKFADYIYYRELHYALNQLEEYLDREAQKKGIK